MPDFIVEGLTEEQNSAIIAEIDRRVSQAVKTTTDKTTQQVAAQLQTKYEQDLAAEIAKTKKETQMTESEKVNAALAELQKQQAQLAQQRLTLTAQRKLEDAGISKDAIDALLPIFVASAKDEDTLSNYVDAFSTTSKNAIEEALDAQKKELASAATAPAGSGTSVQATDFNAQAAAIQTAFKGDSHSTDAYLIQALMNSAKE